MTSPQQRPDTIESTEPTGSSMHDVDAARASDAGTHTPDTTEPTGSSTEPTGSSTEPTG
jgi:hypothetical protein